MVHVHGVRAQDLSSRTVGVGLGRLVAVPVDVGKPTAMAMVCDFTGRRLAAPFTFRQDRAGLVDFVGRVKRVLPDDAALVRVGVEACGHYHRPVVASGLLPAQWQLVELNPAWVSAQRKVNGTARRKTDPIDLVAIADLLLAGRGYEVAVGDESLVQLCAWVAHRRRRVRVRSGLKNQLLGQVDRCFPGLGGALADVLGTKAGRLVVSEFADPARLAKLGVDRFRAFAARAAGLTPAQYESAGRRRDSGISREGSVELRRALLDLGVGLWHRDPAARAYAIGLRERGKPGGIITTAMARRANKIAFAMVRDQTFYDPAVWQRSKG
jgi:transposase